jgi:hypothetical protein
MMIPVENPEEPEDQQVVRADRRFARHERENRFLDKRSEDY